VGLLEDFYDIVMAVAGLALGAVAETSVIGLNECPCEITYIILSIVAIYYEGDKSLNWYTLDTILQYVRILLYMYGVYVFCPQYFRIFFGSAATAVGHHESEGEVIAWMVLQYVLLAMHGTQAYFMVEAEDPVMLGLYSGEFIGDIFFILFHVHGL